MERSTNALAELANALVAIGIKCDDENAAVRISQAQRIVAKLSKVAPMIHRSGKALMYTLEERLAVMDAVDYCRAVAEEGAKV